jgi:isocitrate dehydrogenase (NAD+)
LLAAALMLEHVDRHELATRLRHAIDGAVHTDAVRTPDLGGRSSTRDFTQAIIARVSAAA